MANSKISALTSATTPLVGTETLPIVQGGATVKTTVADITNGGGYAGSFTTLASTGNTTLGDASTDTVRVNGYMGIGGAGNAARAVLISSSALTGVSQIGYDSRPVFSSAATTNGLGVFTAPQTAATAFTMTSAVGYYANDWTKGAGSTITNQHGIYIDNQTTGTNNYGITSAVTSGATKWNIYASGTAQNAFAGNVRIGSVVAPTVALDVTGAVKVSTTITPLDNIVIGTSGKGIDFSVTSEATGMTSELLADYEEGTWTPAYSSTGATFTYAQQYGSYVKVGKLIYAQFYLNVTAAGVITNGATLTGLPYTSTSVNTPFEQGFGGAWSSNVLAIAFTVNPGATTVTLYRQNVTPATAATATNVVGYQVGTLIYRTV
jgi:hypothetical protein